ncbi:MAG: amidohydrolase family protein [Bacteroidota bacterium]
MIRPLATIALVALLLGTEAHAQILRGGTSSDTPRRPVTTAHALTNARVIVAPGRVLDRATVIVRDGRIVAVGEDAEVPFDATVIEADSMWVYAGFLDLYSHAGVEDPDTPEYDGDRGDPPREVAGIVPDRDVRTLYSPSNNAVKALREAGFTAAHLAPHDGLFAGMGAVALLREPGRAEYRESLFLPRTETAIAQIDGASGVYPATPMGVLSVMRETVENARREMASREAFDGDASRALRPSYDPVIDALAPVLSGDRPMIFHADSWLDAHRALRVTEEMTIPTTVLAGVPDVAPVLDKIRSRGVPVIAPLALPDTVKTDSTTAEIALPPPTSTSPGGISFVSARRTTSFRDTEAEKTTLTAQQIASVQRAEASPARLAEAAVPFAFGSFDAKGKDIRENLRRMVEAGLSREDALAALTTSAAEVVGLGGTLGTVEAGKLANLVVTTGDYFVDSTQVRFVFVEGIRHEVEAEKKAAAGDPDAEATALGTWTYSVETPGGTQTGTMIVEGEPGNLSGEIVGEDGEATPFDSISLEGNVLSVQFSADQLSVTLSGTIIGDEFEGTADVGAFGSFPFTATRQPE